MKIMKEDNKEGKKKFKKKKKKKKKLPKYLMYTCGVGGFTFFFFFFVCLFSLVVAGQERGKELRNIHAPAQVYIFKSLKTPFSG